MLLLCFPLGMLVCLSDKFSDFSLRRSWLTSIFSGLIIGWLMTLNPALATVGLGVIFAQIFALKVDNAQHALMVFLSFLIYLLSPQAPLIPALIFILIASFLDEILCNFAYLGKLPRIFELRPLLDFTALALAFLYSPYFLSILTFDAGYTLAFPIWAKMRTSLFVEPKRL